MAGLRSRIELLPASAAAPIAEAGANRAGVRVYPSRAAAEEATVPAPVQRIDVAHGGELLSYRRDAAGTALTTGDGATWSPAAETTLLHWGGGPGASAADNAAALNAAQAAGATVHVSSGIDVAGSNIKLLRLAGDGTAKIVRPAGSDSGTQALFQPEHGARLDAVDIALTEDQVAGSVHVMRWNRSDLALDGVHVDGDVRMVEGVRNHNGSFALVPGGHDVTGMTIRDSHFENMAYLFLKANGTVSTQRNIRITGCTFEDFTNVTLLFNSPAPGSLVEDIAIIGNRVGANFSQSGFWHRGSFAGNVVGGRVAFNYFHGEGGEFFRMEEGAEAHVFTGNVGYFEGPGDHGFETVANEAGGEGFKIPRWTVLSDNVLVAKEGASGHAFHFVFNENGAGLKESIAHDNIAAGEWDSAFRTTREAGTTLVHHNAALGTAAGLQLADPSLSIRDTLMVDVNQPLVSGNGGLLGPIHLRAPDGAFPPVPAEMVVKTGGGVGAGPVGVTGWTWEARRFTLASGSNQMFPLMPLGYMLHGRLTLMFTRNANAHRTIIGTLSWDGTTLSWTPEMVLGEGSVVFPSSGDGAVVAHEGNLAVQISNSGGALSGSSLHVAFEGVHLW